MSQVVNGTHYNSNTPEEVIRILERARRDNTRLFLRIGDAKTGRDWLEEHEVEGRIGRSMGPVKVPLLIPNASSHGGGAILDDCIVGIMTAKGKQVLYKHPKYNRPKFEITDGPLETLPIEILANGEIHARFENRKKAERWMKRFAALAPA